MHERLSPVEAIMWRAGQDPGLRMIVGNLIILDHGPPPEALQSRLAAAAEELHQLRCRPDDLSGAKARPAWIEVPEVDRVAWFDGTEARTRVKETQIPLIERLEAFLAS